MTNDFLFGDKTLIFIFMYKYNNIRLLYVNYKSLNNALKSALNYIHGLFAENQVDISVPNDKSKNIANVFVH